MVIKDDVIRVNSLPTKHTLQNISRGRSAPTLPHAVVPPSRERILSTSAKGVTLLHNKLMPTAEQVRQYVKQRPQSAYIKRPDVATGKHDSIMVSRTTSCLNLKTYSEGLLHEDQTHSPRKSQTNNKGHRPLSCLT